MLRRDVDLLFNLSALIPLFLYLSYSHVKGDIDKGRHTARTPSTNNLVLNLSFLAITVQSTLFAARAFGFLGAGAGAGVAAAAG